MKTYIIILSKTFMKGNPKCGQETFFSTKFAKGQLGNTSKPNKIHTIRSNYDLWKKRIQEVEEGQAILSIRQWTGAPYRSKQEVLANLTNKDGVGIQMIEFANPFIYIDCRPIDHLYLASIASNDGLNIQDWEHWFDFENASGKYAIIHFTNFRY